MLLILLGVVIYSLSEAWQTSKAWAFNSCLYSVGQVVSDLPLSEVRSVTSLSPEWKTLSDSEVERLLSKVRPYDCGGKGEPLSDPWGSRLGVALRQIDPTGRFEVRVWSNGRDRIVGTRDDIVVPSDERVLKGK
jgi:hypothetical protein